MSATATRMLLLGAVAMFQPVNGYQIRRELMSWRVDEWAHTNPGSIYTGLATLERLGHLVRHDLRDGGRDVAVYELTDSGRQELQSLFREAVEAADLHSPLGFHVAFSLLPLIPRKQVLRYLETRAEKLDRRLDELSGPPDPGSPPHVHRMVDLWCRQVTTERVWLTELLAEIRDGGLSFAGEPMTWTPAPDDPGLQMAQDRARYQRMLGRD